MTSATLAPPNAILFVFDRGNSSVSIPDYIDGQPVSANDSCVTVGTQADVDGEVTVTLESPASLALVRGLQKVFAGSLRAPTRTVAIVTADARTVLEQSVNSDMVELEVWADDGRNPTRIVVLAR